jgi:plastocyanin
VKLDERAASARGDLETEFGDTIAPPPARLRATNRRRRAVAIAGVAVVIVVAAAVTASMRHSHTEKQPLVLTPSGSEQPLGDGPADTTLDITTGNTLRFTPDRLETAPGVVRITLTNTGGEHKLLFADPRVRFAGIGVSEPGETRSTRAYFPAPGVYRFYDPLPGHREAGEEGTVLVTGDAQGIEARVELSMTTVVSGGAIDGNLVIDNNSGSPFRFGEGCRTNWTVVLANDSGAMSARIPDACNLAVDLPEGRTALPFIVHAASSAGPLPPGGYEAIFVTDGPSPLHPPRVPVTVTAPNP